MKLTSPYSNDEASSLLSSHSARKVKDYLLEEEQRGKNSWISWGILLGLFITIVFVLSSEDIRVWLNATYTKSTYDDESTDTEKIHDVVFSNEYSNNGKKMFSYPFLEHASLMEPFRDNTVTVTGFDISCNAPKWTFARVDGGLAVESHGTIEEGSIEFIVVPKSTGQYTLEIIQACSDFYVAKTVWVKYVRREISTLTDEDREEFLDAFYELWTTDTIDGQQKYGEKYKDVYYLSSIHNDASSNGFCDEFHGGAGFLANHVLMGAFLEQSLQLINPRVALHYMEYSKYFEIEKDNSFEKHLMNQLDGGTWTEMMTDKWFGSNDPYSGKIIDGRWKDIVLPTMDDDFYIRHGVPKDTPFFTQTAISKKWTTKQTAHMFNPYGLLRSRWNFSPDPYILRFNNVGRIVDVNTDKKGNGIQKYAGVTCYDYWDFLNTSAYDHSLGDILLSMEDKTHGPIHFAFGGAGGDRAAENEQIFRDKYGFDDSEIIYLNFNTHAFIKNQAPFWWLGTGNSYWNCSEIPFRDGVLQSTVGPGEEGGMKCGFIDSVYESDESLNSFFAYYAGQNKKNSNFYPIMTSLPFEEKIEAARLLEQRVQYDGDMATSGAATDPLFWLQHGAVERLFQAICFRDIPTDSVYPSGSDCAGHATWGVKDWLQGYRFVDDTIRPETINNTEMVKYLDPRNDEYMNNIPFVYDSSSFEWCPGGMMERGAHQPVIW